MCGIREKVERLDERLCRFQFLTGNMLKLLAVTAMVIDHLCKIVLQWLLTDYWGEMAETGEMTWERFQQIDTWIRFDLQSVGAMAFPLFCFLLVEGFRHTGNRKRYLGTMLLFAVLSEIPFDIGFFSRYSIKEGTFPFYLEYQNVVFTLSLGLVTLECLVRLQETIGSRVGKAGTICFQGLSVVLIAGVAEIIRCDYGMEGIWIVVAFFVGRKSRIGQVLLFLLAYMLTTGNQPTVWVLLACLAILLYNGTRGVRKIKYSCYVFYPAHIGLLYLVTLALKQCLKG